MATMLLTTVANAAGAVATTAAMQISTSLLNQAIFGNQTQTIQGPRIDRLHLNTASQGAGVPRVWGRMRVGGRLIWTTHFKETVDAQEVGGGKGGGPSTRVEEYSYSLTFAIALAEGPIDRIGRVWFDGAEVDISSMDYRLYLGSEDQQADEAIIDVEGEDAAPAYRGVAYMVFDDLPLGDYGNRVPTISVEVVRTPPAEANATPSPAELVRGVALGPGTGEFSLATTPVRRVVNDGVYVTENAHVLADQTDLSVALDILQDELPNVETVSLIVSWFGDDLRCQHCLIRPGVELTDRQTDPLTWSAGGVGRSGAYLISTDADDRPNFGGTPSDQSVIEAIEELKSRGLRVLLYPFILMDLPDGNGKPDPWSDASDQPSFPWRGRITLNDAPGQSGSSDQTAAAASEVADFFGDASAADFAVGNGSVSYTGPADFRYRRFILHCAALAAAAGGVDAFAIGSEMRSLTQIRDGQSSYPAVAELVALAGEARALLGAETDITYAADWSEYFGHQPSEGSGDVHFHLDPLWSDPNIDAIGIDAYFPLSDWRSDSGLDDEGYRSIYEIDYLRSAMEGGEYYDWYYASDEDRANAIRTDITDGAYGEPWVYRVKDLRNWWSNQHYDRPGGVRSAAPTAWVPESKPIWFTELGCPAVDKGSNQPNVFYDPGSSESFFPYFSTGARDDEMQRRYLQAFLSYWDDASNPVSSVYGGQMLDMGSAHVWNWDARPWPDFPLRGDVWSDSALHEVGHWLTGRLAGADLADLVRALCAEAGVEDVDVDALTDVVDGLKLDAPSAMRGVLEYLGAVYAFDAVESGGTLLFAPRDNLPIASLTTDDMVVDDDGAAQKTGPLSLSRSPSGDPPNRARIRFFDSAWDYSTALREAQRGVEAEDGMATIDAPIAMSETRAQRAVDRLLEEAWTARDTASFALPPSWMALEPTDVVSISTDTGAQSYRIVELEADGARRIEAVRVDRAATVSRALTATSGSISGTTVQATPVVAVMDLPLLTGEEIAVSPSFAAYLDPWPGAMTLWRSHTDEGYAEAGTLSTRAVIGRTASDLPAAEPWLWSRDAGVEISLSGGSLSSRDALAVLNGANAAALQTSDDGWEVFQFQNAELIGDDRYWLSGLLRGQAGSERHIADSLAAGARFVLLNTAIAQPTAREADVGLERYFRIGPSSSAIDAATHALVVHSAAGTGLTPYAPVHLAAAEQSSGDLSVSWIRRSRIGGDRWDGGEPPIGEEAELYRLRLHKDGAVIFEQETSTAAASIAAADQPDRPFDIGVAQVSAAIGAGPETLITLV